MASTLAQEGFETVSTGEVLRIEPATEGITVTFGPVLGIEVKHKMYKNLITYENLESINSFL